MVQKPCSCRLTLSIIYNPVQLSFPLMRLLLQKNLSESPDRGDRRYNEWYKTLLLVAAISWKEGVGFEEVIRKVLGQDVRTGAIDSGRLGCLGDLWKGHLSTETFTYRTASGPKVDSSELYRYGKNEFAPHFTNILSSYPRGIYRQLQNTVLKHEHAANQHRR